jgi:large subunit ribosomal protein L35
LPKDISRGDHVGVRSHRKEISFMPKMKSNRGASKRFKTTGTGKLRRAHSSKSHLLTGKATRRMRKLRHGTLVDKTDLKRMRVLFPYG